MLYSTRRHNKRGFLQRHNQKLSDNVVWEHAGIICSIWLWHQHNLCEPCPDFKDDTTIAEFVDVFNKFKTKRYIPVFNATDNQVTAPSKAFLKIEWWKWQFVKPSTHHVTTTEHAIQTFKNHFISGLSSTNLHCPPALLDYLLTQAMLTLNLRCTSRTYPIKLSYEQLNGNTYN